MPSECARRRAPRPPPASSSALAPSVARVGPELHGHRDHLRPALALEQGGDGAVDAAGDRDQDAVRRRARRALVLGGRRPRRARCAARRRRAGGVAACGPAKAAERAHRARRRRCAPPRARVRPAADLPTAAAVAARVAAQPSESKVTAVTLPVLDRERDPGEVAAGRAAGGAREGARRRRGLPAPSLR